MLFRSVGYIVKIRTMKHARRLMSRWHEKDIGDQKLKCQLEFNPKFAAQRGRSGQRGTSIDGKGFANRPSRSRRRTRATRSVQSDFDPSAMRDIDNGDARSTLENRELDKDRRIMQQATKGIIPRSSNTNLSRGNSSENIASLASSKCTFARPQK